MKRVLIVDDAEYIRGTLRNILERNGFEIIGEAESGSEALGMVKEMKPDIVTMDIIMPGLDGIQAVKKIKAASPDTDIFMVSALGHQKLVIDAIQSGAAGYILKPFNEDQIMKVFNEV